MGDVDSSTNRILNPVSIKKIGGKKIIEINIEWINERKSRGYYHMLKLTNDNYKNQDIYDNDIKYEK